MAAADPPELVWTQASRGSALAAKVRRIVHQALAAALVVQEKRWGAMRPAIWAGELAWASVKRGSRASRWAFDRAREKSPEFASATATVLTSGVSVMAVALPLGESVAARARLWGAALQEQVASRHAAAFVAAVALPTDSSLQRMDARLLARSCSRTPAARL